MKTVYQLIIFVLFFGGFFFFVKCIHVFWSFFFLEKFLFHQQRVVFVWLASCSLKVSFNMLQPKKGIFINYTPLLVSLINFKRKVFSYQNRKTSFESNKQNFIFFFFFFFFFVFFFFFFFFYYCFLYFFFLLH